MKSILIFIALVGIGVGVWYGGRLLTEPASDTHVLPGVEVAAGEMRYAEEGQYYTAAASYPARTSLRAPADKKARDTMEMYVQNDIAEFKKNINADQSSGPEKAMLNSTGRTYTYDAKYKQYAGADSRLISYEYAMYIDTGGAHPNGFFKTFIFGTEGNEVKLSDLFQPESDYLQRISTIALADVKQELSERLGKDASASIFAEGLAPTEENFSNFVIDGDTLVIFISSYQAAAYAAGTFEIRIPLSQFSDILRPEWK